MAVTLWLRLVFRFGLDGSTAWNRNMKNIKLAQLVVLGLAVHGVAGSILLWGHFPVEGIFPLELTWVQTPFPKKLLRMRV